MSSPSIRGASQYLKDGPAMRIETVINASRELGCNAGLPNLEAVQSKARVANHRILEAGLASSDCHFLSETPCSHSYPYATRSPFGRYNEGNSHP